MAKLLLIDGHSILVRAFYGLPDFVSSVGAHTGAVHGFLNILLKSIETERADFAAAAFDMDRKALLRTRLYPDYKGTRRPMPEELLEQVPIVQKLLLAMNIPVYTLLGYEADDILGTLARKGESGGMEVTIVSGDRDLLQLCSEHIKVSVPKTSKGRTQVFNYYPEDVFREYHVTPTEFIDMKALMGDSSDNVPGLPGVGPKTACELIMKYGSIENTHLHAEELKPGRAKTGLLEHYDLAVLSKKLVTIDTHVPIEEIDWMRPMESAEGETPAAGEPPESAGEPAAQTAGFGRTDGIYTPESVRILRELELRNLTARFAAHLKASGTAAPSSAGESDDLAPQPTGAAQRRVPSAHESLRDINRGRNPAAGEPPDPVAGESPEFPETAGETAATIAPAAAAEVLLLRYLKEVTDPYMAELLMRDARDEDIIGFGLFVQPAEAPAAAAAALALQPDRVYLIVSGAEYPPEKLTLDLSKLLGARIAARKVSATFDLKEALKYLDIDKNEYIYDLKIAEYLMAPGRNHYSYATLSKRLWGIDLEEPSELLGKKSIFDALGISPTYEAEQIGLFRDPAAAPPTAGAEPPDTSQKHAALRLAGLAAAVPFLAAAPAAERLEKDGTKELFLHIETPLIYTLSSMEKIGIEVDSAALSELERKFGEEIDLLEKEIHELAGEDFNINSPRQLGCILFEKLAIKAGRKTKTGYSTSADVLEKARDLHPIVPKILRYRTVTKLYSTYAKGLKDYISPDRRIHGSFNQTIAATGRLTSTEPNLQNIPVRTEEGKEIRRVFVPRKGYVFTDADYSQVELRILAALSGDETLIEAYRNAADIHTLTASLVFGVPEEEVTGEMRRSAKAVNFGIVYGISAFGLGEDLSIDRKKASEYIEKYFATYPGVRKYLDDCVKSAAKLGYVRTYFGRIRPVPELKNSNYMVHSQGERIAMNTPVQGTAADIMKIAMNRVDDMLRREKMNSRLVLQVHDELLVETDPEELEKVREILRDSMEHAADIGVLLCVDIREGRSWYECH